MFDAFYKMSMLALESHQVIGMRLMKGMLGGTAAADEAALMISEKAEAAMRWGPAFLTNGSLDEMIDDYRTIVQANVARLTEA